MLNTSEAVSMDSSNGTGANSDTGGTRHNVLDALDGLGIGSDGSSGYRDVHQALATAQIQLQM